METKELIQVVEKSELEPTTSQSLQDSFLPFFEQAKQWEEKAKGLVVTSEDQKREMKMAREARLALREIRINADKKRKSLKQDSLRYGKAVQGVYNVIEYLISPIEEHLLAQEKFAENKEAERKAALKSLREDELSEFSEFVPLGVDLANMDESDYKKLLSGSRLQQQAKIEAERKAEQERIEAERAEAEERARIQAENELLKKQAEAKEKELAEERAKFEAEKKKAEEEARIEREAQQQKIEAERKERLRLEAEAEAKRLEKEQAEKEQAEAARKAANAPDKEKLILFARKIESLTVSVDGEDAQNICNEATKRLLEVALFVRKSIEKL